MISVTFTKWNLSLVLWVREIMYSPIYISIDTNRDYIYIYIYRTAGRSRGGVHEVFMMITKGNIWIITKPKVVL